MKPAGMATSQNKTSRAIEGTITDSGLDLETKIFSPSGRGRGFFLTFLFIELKTPPEEGNDRNRDISPAIVARRRKSLPLIDSPRDESNEYK